MRPSKIIRLNYWSERPEDSAHISILGKPEEIRISSSADKFLSVRKDGISIAPGISNSINIQGMSHNMKYAGMISDLPFPLSMLPNTPVTPLPKQVFVPPLKDLLSLIKDISIITKSFVGI